MALWQAEGPKSCPKIYIFRAKVCSNYVHISSGFLMRKKVKRDNSDGCSEWVAVVACSDEIQFYVQNSYFTNLHMPIDYKYRGTCGKSLSGFNEVVRVEMRFF